MPHLKKRFTYWLLWIALLAACATPTTVAPTSPPAPSGGVLRWAVEGVDDLPALDPPLIGASQSAGVAGLIFDGLVRLDRDLRVIPAGAESWEILDGGQTFVFHLRPNLKFANGDPVTAEDFAYSLNRAFRKDFTTGTAGYYLSNIAGATEVTEGKAATVSGVIVRDPQTLEIRLKTPAAYFLDQLTFPSAFVVPRKAVEADPQNWINQAYGTGPFMIKEWKHAQSLTLVPNPNYWQGQPRLEQIELVFIQDAVAALRRYQSGALDIMGTYAFPAEHVPDVINLPDFHQVNQFFVTYLGFNNAQAPFKDVRVRQAFAQGVDKRALLAQVFGDTVVEANTLIPPGMPGYNSQVKVQEFNVAEAQRLLAEAGYPNGKGFPEIALTVNDQDAAYLKLASGLQQMWRDNLGVSLSVHSVKLSQFNADLTAMATDPLAPTAYAVYLSVWGADYPDPQNFVSQQLRTGVGNNNGHYSNAQFDQLVDRADTDSNPEVRYQLYREAEQIALNEVGWLPLFYGQANLLIRPTVQGFVVTPQGLVPKADWSQITVEK